MTSHEQEQDLERLRFDSKRTVIAMAEVIAGQSLDGDLERALLQLSKSPEIGARGDTPFPRLETLSEDQRAAIRAEGQKLGIGAKESIGLMERGLPQGTTVKVENGLPNKLLAQLHAIAEGEVQPGVVVITASSTRAAGAQDVRRMGQIAERLNVEVPEIEGRTEFDNTPDIALLNPDFTAVEAAVLPFGYDMYDGGVNVTHASTRQAVLIGRLKDSPVVMVETKELHRDDSGKNFFRPGTAHFDELSREIAGYFDESYAELPTATVTSHLYGRSRMLQDPNTITYGTEAMETVIPPEETPLNQIVGEAQRVGEVLLGR